jgi:hypothetical protein
LAELVAVHGIAQQQLGRHQLQAPWSRALADGLERSAGHLVPVPDLTIAYYGDVFLAKDGDTKGAVPDDDIADDEVDDLVDATNEILSEEELAAASEQVPKGRPGGRVPRPVQVALAALDRRFGPHTGWLFVGELRQVRRYLLDEGLKAAVDQRLRAAVGPDCQVLIGHSLGSVVALEFLRLNPDHALRTLITAGSPLGLRSIRSWSPEPEFARTGGIPANTAAWVNIRDPRDPVTCGGDLSQWWSRIADRTVDNGTSAHSAERYLSKRHTGDAVLAALPRLAL